MTLTRVPDQDPVVPRPFQNVPGPVPTAGTRSRVPLKKFLWILTVFTLGNSSDAFLLLRLSDAGVPLMG